MVVSTLQKNEKRKRLLFQPGTRQSSHQADFTPFDGWLNIVSDFKPLPTTVVGIDGFLPVLEGGKRANPSKLVFAFEILPSRYVGYPIFFHEGPSNFEVFQKDILAARMKPIDSQFVDHGDLPFE